MDNKKKSYCNCPVVDNNHVCWKGIPMQITEETTQIEEVVTAETTTEEVAEVATEETIEPEYVDEQTAEETTEEVVEVEANEEEAA